MLLRKRRKKLMRILIIGLLIFGMIGMAIPESILAADTSISVSNLKKGDIIFPGDEIEGMTGSKSYIVYGIGSGKFVAEDNNSILTGHYIEGSRFQTSSSPHKIMDYEEVISKSQDGYPVNALPEGSVFAGWIMTNIYYGTEINLVPIIVSYDNGLIPSVHYDTVNRIINVTTQNNSEDFFLYGDVFQKISSKELINISCSINFSNSTVKTCDVTLTTKSYSQDDMDNAHIVAKHKAIINKIDMVKEGENVTLEVNDIQLTGTLSNIRYIPDSWSVDELKLSGNFEQVNSKAKNITSTYKAEIPAKKAGDYKVNVSWSVQILKDGEWEDVNSNDDFTQFTISSNYKVLQVSTDTSNPSDPEKPVINPSDTEKPVIHPNDSGQSEGEHSSEPDNNQNNGNINQTKNQEKSNSYKPTTQDKTALWITSFVCIGSLATIGTIVYRRKKV